MRGNLPPAVALSAVLLSAVLLSAAGAFADEILVPGDAFRDLQNALDTARPGDTILLGRGTYRGPFTLETERVAIVGEEGTRIVGPGIDRSCGNVAPALVIRAGRVAVRGIEFRRGGVQALGTYVSVESCTFRRIGDRRGDATAVDLQGYGPSVTDSAFLLGGRAPRDVTGVRMRGDEARVSGLNVEGAPGTRPIQVEGDRARVSGNSVATSGTAGILLAGSEGSTVAGNILAGGSIEVRGLGTGGNTVSGNSSVGGCLGLPTILVEGDGNTVEDNESRFGEDSGIVIVGDGNVVRRNTVSYHGRTVDWTPLGHGFVVHGSWNRLEGNVSEGNVGEGISVSGSGEWVPSADGFSWEPATGEGNSVVDCVATGSGTCGLGNWTPGTRVTGSTFTGNGVDVLDGFGFGLFEGNTYETGGPGVADADFVASPDFGLPSSGGRGGGGD